MNCALYARYSSENQRESSIEDQNRNCEAYAARHGWTITHRYHDKAISGSTHERPGYQQMLKDARHAAGNPTGASGMGPVDFRAVCGGLVPSQNRRRVKPAASAVTGRGLSAPLHAPLHLVCECVTLRCPRRNRPAK